MLSAVQKVVMQLQLESKRNEARAVRIVARHYKNLNLADLMALVAQVSDTPAPAKRVAELDRLMGAFGRAAQELAQSPDAMSALLQNAVRSGVYASGDMIAAAGGALEAFRVAPDIEMGYVSAARTRFGLYWDKEQRRMADEVQSALFEGLDRGQSSAQIANRLTERVQVSRSRATLIARNELGNASAYGQQVTQEEAGITHYEWVAASDERVRPEHQARNGKIFAWDKPPADGHPGQPIQCRCVSVPVIAGVRELPKPEEKPKTKPEEKPKEKPEAKPEDKPEQESSLDLASEKLVVKGNGKLAGFARRALEIIDSVHGVENLKEIPFGTSHSKKELGSMHRFPDGSSAKLVLSSSSPHPLMTVAHEVGHWIHNDALGGTIHWDRADPDLRAVVETARSTATIERVRTDFNEGKITMDDHNYYRDPREIWARAYAQYVAQKSGDEDMLKQLKGMRTGMRQWPEDEFKPVFEKIDELLTKKGWRKEKKDAGL